MIYYIYKIRLLKGRLAGKYYIGQHRTNDMNDGYIGSGTILRNYFKSYKPVEGETYIKEILCYCSSVNELNEAEKRLISDKYESDPDCINLIAGGRGKGFSKETRLKISESNKGKIMPDDTRKRISDKLMGHEISEETRAKIRETLTKTLSTPEARKRLSDGQKNRPPITEETRRKLSEANKGKVCCWRGKKMPKEIREKMSESQKGFVCVNNGVELKRIRKELLESYISDGWVCGMRDCDKEKNSRTHKGIAMSEEAKAKLSLINKGRKMSEEAREKIAAINRAKANDPVIRKKISDAKKGKKHSPEWIEHAAAARRGKPQSEEARRKRSETMKGYHWYFDKQLNRRVYVHENNQRQASV